MLGWEIFVYRHGDGKQGTLVARWNASVSGLRWLNSLAKEHKAVEIIGNGYPDKFLVSAGVLLPIIAAGIPKDDGPLVIGDDYVIPEEWNSEINWNREAVMSCEKFELLTVEAWDQS